MGVGVVGVGVGVDVEIAGRPVCYNYSAYLTKEIQYILHKKNELRVSRDAGTSMSSCNCWVHCCHSGSHAATHTPEKKHFDKGHGATNGLSTPHTTHTTDSIPHARFTYLLIELVYCLGYECSITGNAVIARNHPFLNHTHAVVFIC